MTDYNVLCLSCVEMLGESEADRRYLDNGLGHSIICRGCGYKVVAKYRATTEEILEVRRMTDNED